MRVQSFLSFGLFGLRATAVPSLSLRQTNEEIKEEIDKQIGDLEPGCLIVFEPEREMCTNNKTPKMWKDLGIGPWLQVVTIGMHPFQTGLYESIRDRNKKLHDIKCGDVISPDGLSSFGDCDDLTNEDQCLCQPYAFFALSAMHNFVNYMEKLRNAIGTAGQIVGYQTMSMPKQYNPSTENAEGSDLALIGGIMGILGTLTGAIPPIAPLGVGFGLISGILGMIGDEKELPDPIAPIAEIQSRLGHQVEAMMQAVAKYTKHLLYDIPPATKDEFGYETVYTDDPKEMVAILGNEGAWVSEPGPIDGTQLKLALAAPAINALWGKEKVFVAKISNAGNILGVNPCETDEIFGPDMKHCDSDGTMYVVRKWQERAFPDRESTANTDVPGWKNATEEYGLTVKTIAKSSEANQNGGGKYFPSPPSPTEFTANFLKRDFSQVSDRDMVFFSLPVCDINNAPMMDTTAYDRCESAKCRFNYLLLCRCAGNYEKAYNSKGGENNKQFHGEAFPYNVLATTCDAFMQYDL